MTLEELKFLQQNDLEYKYNIGKNESIYAGKINLLNEECFGYFLFKNNTLIKVWELWPCNCISEKNYPNKEDQEKKFNYWIQIFSKNFGDPKIEQTVLGRIALWEINNFTISAIATDRGKSPCEAGYVTIDIKGEN